MGIPVRVVVSLVNFRKNQMLKMLSYRPSLVSNYEKSKFLGTLKPPRIFRASRSAPFMSDFGWLILARMKTFLNSKLGVLLANCS